MASSGELANALTETLREPKTEDSNYDDQPGFTQDLDTDEKPDIDNEEPSTPQHDADMEDLFGDDKPAEEITHHEGSVIQLLYSSLRVLNVTRRSQGHNAGFL